MNFAASNKAALEVSHDFALEQQLGSRTVLLSALTSCQKYQELSSTIDLTETELSLSNPEEARLKLDEYIELCESLESMDSVLLDGCFIRPSDDFNSQLGQQLPALRAISDCRRSEKAKVSHQPMGTWGKQ